MFSHQTNLRPRYAETDQMGVVYYGNYPQYFEVARVEALRHLGLSYQQMESSGIMMPVLKLEVKYIQPALYDDELKIVTFIDELPSSRITFKHEIFDSSGKLLTKGMVQLVFVNKESKRPVRCPAELNKTLAPFFAED